MYISPIYLIVALLLSLALIIILRKFYIQREYFKKRQGQLVDEIFLNSRPSGTPFVVIDIIRKESGQHGKGIYSIEEKSMDFQETVSIKYYQLSNEVFRGNPEANVLYKLANEKEFNDRQVRLEKGAFFTQIKNFGPAAIASQA